MAMRPGSVSRRDFTRLFAAGGSAALFAHPAWAQMPPASASLPSGGAAMGEPFWKAVRTQFVMPPELAVLIDRLPYSSVRAVPTAGVPPPEPPPPGFAVCTMSHLSRILPLPASTK